MLAGTLRGDGDPVLLLHGGPGLSVDYLEPLADELADGYAVAAYQQRGQEPSARDGPFEVADHVDDVRRVLDALGWERALVVGHSWGGHLALHVALAIPDRVRAVLAIDPLGAVGDGGSAEFEQEIERPDTGGGPGARRGARRAGDARRGHRGGRAGEPGAGLAGVLRRPGVRSSDAADQDVRRVLRRTPWRRSSASCPRLELGLPGIDLPVGFVVGAGSPMPATASTDTAQRIPAPGWTPCPDAGHFVWLDAPGRVRSALDRLTAPGD